MPKSGQNQTYLFVRLHSNAIWTQKSQNLVHREESHSLRRHLFAASLPQTYQVKSLLSKKVFFAQRNNHYTISEVILALVYPIAHGFSRIETTHLLRHNGVFQYLTELPSYPDPQTLRHFLLRMEVLQRPSCRGTHHQKAQRRYPLAKIPTEHFAANEAYFHILLFSYNLINWFKRLYLPAEVQSMTLNTLRARILLIHGCR